MSRRLIGYCFWLLLAGCLYFFENNTGTRIVLCCSLLPPLIPAFRRMFFASDRAEAPRPQPVTVKTFCFREEEESSEVRAYRPGDPVNRMHWKLSAKRNEPLIRTPGWETVPLEAKAESSVSADAGRVRRGRRRPVLLILAALAFLMLCLLLIPAARDGALALCNRLFEASEQANAYVYSRFPVPADQPAALAAALLLPIPVLLLGLVFLSGSRLLALCLMAGCTAFQTYFGLSFPGWANVSLFALFALWMMKRPPMRKDALLLLSAVLAVSLAVALLCPGVDAATEAASERARDALSRMAGQAAGTVPEAPEGENEVRRAHTQSLTEGEREALAEKEYRLETVEEAQISMPRWINYLKIALLLLAAAAVVILPFLPFLWLNARRKKALNIQKAFAAGDVKAAVRAVFQHVIAWLEAMGHGAGNLPYRDWAGCLPPGMPPGYGQRFSQCAALFEEAAYSDHAMDEDARQQALALLSETEQALLAQADWKQRLRLKYGDCLWIEKAD